MAGKASITPEYLQQLLRYDPDTGDLWWKKFRQGTKRGHPAGNISQGGYRAICIDGVQLLAHRVAWAIYYGDWPENVLDHINSDPGDNRIANLRAATIQQNSCNQPARRKDGMKGIARYGKGYEARIKVRGITYRLGTFQTVEDAHAAYCRAAVKFHVEFARFR